MASYIYKWAIEKIIADWQIRILIWPYQIQNTCAYNKYAISCTIRKYEADTVGVEDAFKTACDVTRTLVYCQNY